MNNQHLEYKSDNPNYQSFENELYLKDYIIIFRIHLKKIIIIFFVFLLIGIYTTYSKEPQYRAVASVMITQKPGAQSLQSFSSSDNNSIINDKILLIKSRGLLTGVAKDLWNSTRRNNMFLFDTRKFYPKGQSVRTMVKELFTLGLYDAEEANKSKVLLGDYTDEVGEIYAKRIQDKLSANRQGGTNMINISYVSKNADEARRILNRVVRKFVIKDKEWTNKYAINSISFLDSLVNLQEKKIELSEDKKMKFLLENNLYSMEAQSGIIISQINDIEMEILAIETELSIQQKKIDLLRSKFSNLEEKLTNQLMENINSHLTSLRAELGRIESMITLNSGTYGDDHGSVIELYEKRNLIQAEINKKVALLIERGIVNGDPLVVREQQISEILNLENGMIGLKLKENRKKKC